MRLLGVLVMDSGGLLAGRMISMSCGLGARLAAEPSTTARYDNRLSCRREMLTWLK